MRFSARSKVGTLLSLITIVTLIGAFAVTIISRGSPTHASSASTFQAAQAPGYAVRNIQVPSSSAGVSNLVSHSPAIHAATLTVRHTPSSLLSVQLGHRSLYQVANRA